MATNSDGWIINRAIELQLKVGSVNAVVLDYFRYLIQCIVKVKIMIIVQATGRFCVIVHTILISDVLHPVRIDRNEYHILIHRFKELIKVVLRCLDNKDLFAPIIPPQLPRLHPPDVPVKSPVELVHDLIELLSVVSHDTQRQWAFLCVLVEPLDTSDAVYTGDGAVFPLSLCKVLRILCIDPITHEIYPGSV